MKSIPSLKDLQKRIASNIRSKLDISDSNLKSVIEVMAGVLAAEIKMCYLHLFDIQNNLFPDTADLAENGGELNRIGQIQLNRQPKPATDGIYTVSITSLPGSSIRAGLTFKSNEDSKSPGNLYISDSEYILTGTNDVISIRSLSAGPEYQLSINDRLTATEPIIGVNQVASVKSITQAPTSAESIDVYRQNILDSIRLEPQGGARTDYRLWASDAQGVRLVYPYVKNGFPGVIQIFVESTKMDSVDGKGTPSPAILQAVREVIEFDPDTTIDTNLRGRRPAQAYPEILSISLKPVDVVVYSLQIDNSDVRSAIFSNLETYLTNVRPFIAGTDLSRDKNDVLTSVKIQTVVTDTIGNANSFLDFKLSVDGVEVSSFTFSGGNIPYLRNIIYG